MNLRLVRLQFDPGFTIGQLYVNDAPECFVCEDTVRDGPKVPGATAIPYGEYVLVIDMSQRFQKMMPHILNVPGFDGIRIHCGNDAADTEGCLLVGEDRMGSGVGRSVVAFSRLMPKLMDAWHRGEHMTISITKADAATLPPDNVA